MLGVQAQEISCNPPTHTWEMQYWHRRRIDVYTDEHLDRYEQLFEMTMSHTCFGMGETQSLSFITFFTMEDICVLRCTCFAVGVELHDLIDIMVANELTLVHTPPGGQQFGICWLL